MSNKIKMVGLDMDGTTFNDDKVISEKNKKAIEDAIRQGVVVLPATGRPLIGLPKAITDIPGVTYAVTSNGAAIYDLRTNEAIYTDAIPNAKAVAITELLQAHGYLPEVYVDGVCYVDEDMYPKIFEFDIPKVIHEYIKVSRKPVKHLVQFLKDTGKDIHKIHMLFDRRYPQIRAEAFRLMAQFDGLLVSCASDFNIEINSETADKGNALLELGKILGIKKEEIMAMGDEKNDIPMLTKVGFSVAMGNATKEVKECADAVTLTNNEDGVAAAFEKWVL